MHAIGRGKREYSLITVIVVSLLITTVSLFHNDVFSSKTNVIKWDGYGYYVHLPALFIYHDAGEFGFVEEHMNNYAISDSPYQIRSLENGRKYSVYNIGLAILWLPLFMVAHVFSYLSHFPADGLSFPYQLSVVISSLIYFFLGLLYLRKFLRKYLDDGIVAMTITLLVLGTNYFYYLTDGIELTHIYLFSLLAMFLFYCSEYLEKNTGKSFLFSALVLGLMTLIRSSEILLILIPTLWGLSLAKVKSNFVGLISTQFVKTGKYLIVAVLVFSLQLLYYKLTTDNWFIDGYDDHHFDFLNPHLYECLIGYRRGWLIYTPMMLFGLGGITLLTKGLSDWFWPILIFILVNCYVLFSWDIWWYGSTFGCRPIVQSYALLALPLGAFLSYILKSKIAIRWLVMSMAAVFLALNLFQTWQYHQRIIPLDLVTKDYYWEVFLKTKKDKHDNILLDIPEKKPASVEFQSTIFNLEEKLTSLPKNHNDYKEYQTIYQTTINDKLRAELEWLVINLTVSYQGDSFNKWKCPKLITEIKRGKENIKWTNLRIPQVINNKELDKLTYSQSIPPLQDGDEMKVYLWNNTKDQVIISSLDIESWK